MKNYMKASLLLATGTLLAASMLTGCAPMDAFKPEKAEVEDAQKKLELPENLSQTLADLLITALEADPVAVFSETVESDEISVQGFVNLFDLSGQNVIQGVSSQKYFRGNTRNDGSGADKYEVQVKIFARSAGFNRELSYAGVLMNSVDTRTKGFVELERISADENLDALLDCLDIDPPLKEALKSTEAYNVKVLAACFDKTCDTVAVKLQLQNQKDDALDSRVGLAFEDRSSPGKNLKDEEVSLTLTEASLKNLMSFADAAANRQAEKEIPPQCEISVDEEGDENSTEDYSAGASAEEQSVLNPDAGDNAAPRQEEDVESSETSESGAAPEDLIEEIRDSVTAGAADAEVDETLGEEPKAVEKSTDEAPVAEEVHEEESQDEDDVSDAKREKTPEEKAYAPFD